MNCTDFAAFLDRYLDQELAAEQQQAFESHAGQCRDCRRDLKHAETVHQDLQACSVVRCPDHITSTALAAIRSHHAPWRRLAAHWPQFAAATAVCVIVALLVARFDRTPAGLPFVSERSTTTDSGRNTTYPQPAAQAFGPETMTIEHAEQYYREALTTLVYVMNTMKATDHIMRTEGLQDGLVKPLQTGMQKVFTSAEEKTP